MRRSSAPGAMRATRREGLKISGSPDRSLTKISGKLTQDWVKNWVRDPSAIKNVTWMPKVWYNNSKSAADHPRTRRKSMRRSHTCSRTARPTFRPLRRRRKATPRRASNRAIDRLPRVPHHRGERSCRGRPRRTFGQPLKSVGSKTTYTWLYSWVRDPKYYNPRLTCQTCAH